MNRSKNWLLVGNRLGFSLDMSKCQNFAKKTWPARSDAVVEPLAWALAIRPVGHAALLARPANHLSAMGVRSKQTNATKTANGQQLPSKDRSSDGLVLCYFIFFTSTVFFLFSFRNIADAVAPTRQEVGPVLCLGHK